MTFNLYIMRHAKSDWSGLGTSDFDRPINKRGKKNAKQIGQWMDERKHWPEKIVSSNAVRAKQTTEQVIAQFSCSITEKVYYDKDLYLSSVETLIESINLYKQDLNSLMLVAHNPGLEQLVEYLSRKSINSDDCTIKLTTANLVIFQYPDSHFKPELDTNERLEFIKPKELA